MAFITSSASTSFGGVAGVGINSSITHCSEAIIISRSGRDTLFISLGLLGFLAAPFYFAGSGGVRAILRGEISGDGVFLIMSTVLIVTIAVLYIRSSIIRRARVIVSPDTQTVRYVHPGYSEEEIHVSEIASIDVKRREGISAHLGYNAPFTYTVTLDLKDDNEIDIASNTSKKRMSELLLDVRQTLAI